MFLSGDLNKHRTKKENKPWFGQMKLQSCILLVVLEHATHTHIYKYIYPIGFVQFLDFESILTKLFLTGS